MAKGARDYLPIPASEVDVERLFNVCRDILGARRFAMSSNTLSTVMMLKGMLRRQESSQIVFLLGFYIRVFYWNLDNIHLTPLL
jgi:hypothetical protein